MIVSEMSIMRRCGLSLQRQAEGQDRGAAEVTVHQKTKQPPPTDYSSQRSWRTGIPSGISYQSLYERYQQRIKTLTSQCENSVLAFSVVACRNSSRISTPSQLTPVCFERQSRALDYHNGLCSSITDIDRSFGPPTCSNRRSSRPGTCPVSSWNPVCLNCEERAGWSDSGPSRISRWLFSRQVPSLDHTERVRYSRPYLFQVVLIIYAGVVTPEMLCSSAMGQMWSRPQVAVPLPVAHGSHHTMVQPGLPRAMLTLITLFRCPMPGRCVYPLASKTCVKRTDLCMLVGCL